MKCPNCGYNTVDWAERCKKCNARLQPKAKVRMVYPSGGQAKGRGSIGYEKSMRYGGTGEEGQVSYASSFRQGEYEGSKTRKPRQNKKIIEVAPEENGLNAVEAGDSSPFLLSGSDELISDDIIQLQDDVVDGSAPSASRIETVSLEVASFGSRAVAYVIDSIILLGVTAVILGAGMSFGSISLDAQSGMGGLVWSYLAVFLLSSTYYVFLHGAGGRTIGKMICKIKVIREDGEVLGFPKAFIRWIGYFVSSIFCIGFIWTIFDSQGQALHDKIAKTYVIKDQ